MLEDIDEIQSGKRRLHPKKKGEGGDQNGVSSSVAYYRKGTESEA